MTLPALTRDCDTCRHARFSYYGGISEPPGCDQDCTVLDRDLTTPGSRALRVFNDTVIERIMERGGCPAWQACKCAKHGKVGNSAYGCDECAREENEAEELYYRTTGEMS
jgi:hypothetical protein